MREAEIYESKFMQREWRATPVIKKMMQSEFYYMEYTYKQIKLIDFEEVKILKNPEIIKTEKIFIKNRILRNEKFHEAPKNIP